jgi:hypothetical protein
VDFNGAMFVAGHVIFMGDRLMLAGGVVLSREPLLDFKSFIFFKNKIK